jgi:hyperosmotically inducible protein
VAAPSPVAQNDTVGTAANDQANPAKSKASDHSDRHLARTRNSGAAADTRVASAASSNSSRSDDSASKPVPAPSATDTQSSPPAGAIADTQQAPSPTGVEAATSAGAATASNEPVASDSQITADVKSQIATAAPNSNVDATTTNGVVALSGSAASQDAVDQARQAAQQVAGVKHVDASAVTVSNQ